MTSSTLLSVGQRSPAFEAARRLGYQIVCVDEKPPPKRLAANLAGFFLCPFSAATDWDEVAARISASFRVSAVFALTERSVVPAAFLRNALGVPGDPPDAALRATDKLLMKRAVAAAGIACARFRDADGEPLSGDELLADLGLPLVCKARVSSGGRLNRICRAPTELPRRLTKDWIAESFVPGEEMSIESFIRNGEPVFTNLTEYFVPRWANILPAVLPDDERQAIEELNRRVIRALGLVSGFTHLELFRTQSGPIFGEIAARPPGGHLTELIQLAYGFDPWEAWFRLEHGEPFDRPQRVRQSAGVFVLHPGAGTVATVRGLDAARQQPGVEAVYCRLRPGQRVGERLGAGEEKGYILVTGADRDQVAERLLRAQRTLEVEMQTAG